MQARLTNNMYTSLDLDMKRVGVKGFEPEFNINQRHTDRNERLRLSH